MSVSETVSEIRATCERYATLRARAVCIAELLGSDPDNEGYARLSIDDQDAILEWLGYEYDYGDCVRSEAAVTFPAAFLDIVEPDAVERAVSALLETRERAKAEQEAAEIRERAALARYRESQEQQLEIQELTRLLAKYGAAVKS
jgi:hypothetical protein